MEQMPSSHKPQTLRFAQGDSVVMLSAAKHLRFGGQGRDWEHGAQLFRSKLREMKPKGVKPLPGAIWCAVQLPRNRSNKQCFFLRGLCVSAALLGGLGESPPQWRQATSTLNPASR
jgi:hypothetical protein